MNLKGFEWIVWKWNSCLD